MAQVAGTGGHAGQADAQHAFDALHTDRTEFAVDTVHRFLEVAYSGYLQRRR